MTTPAPLPAGWYDDPFTDHLQRYWTGDSWTRETRLRPGAVAEPPSAYPAPAAAPGISTDGAPIRDWLIPSILALIFCAWPLAIPGLIFAIKANGSRKRGDLQAASRQADRAKLFVILSVVFGVVVWVYLGVVISTTELPTDQGPITPFGT